MAVKLWCVNFRADQDVHVERFGCGCGELGEDATHLQLMATKRSLRHDFLITQYGDVVVSAKAAQCLKCARLENLELRPRVKLFVKGQPSNTRWLAILPRGFAGVVHPSSGTRITRYNARDELIVFSSPADPRWKSDPALYTQAGDAFRLWPFYNRIFVSDRFRACVQDNQLSGIELLPFEAKEPRSGSCYHHARHGSVTLGPLPWWLADWQREATWAQLQALAAPGLLPMEMPAFLERRSPNERRGGDGARMSGMGEGWQLSRRREFQRFEAKLKLEALGYVKVEIACPGSDAWTLRDLLWDGDRMNDGRPERRWRVRAYPTPIWVTAELRGEQLVFSYFE